MQPNTPNGMNDESLRSRYMEAVKNMHCYYGRTPQSRFDEYDAFRVIWAEELWKWLYGGNPRGIFSLTEFAWKVQHDRISDGGRKIACLNFSDRNQRVYLGDGLLAYLGLLKDETEKVYEANQNINDH